jgi:hypothetical protein
VEKFNHLKDRCPRQRARGKAAKAAKAEKSAKHAKAEKPTAAEESD